MLGNYLQQTTSAEDIFECIFFLGALRVKQVNMIILTYLEAAFSNTDEPYADLMLSMSEKSTKLYN